MKYWQVRYLLLGLAIAIALYFALIPVRLKEVRSQVPEPQAIFVLGGGREREVAAAGLAVLHPELDVWISTGASSKERAEIFRRAGVSLNRLHLDYRASDTVTNFTTMAGVFRQQGIRHVLLLTSDFHMRRSQAIAFFVFGSRGITYSPMVIKSERSQESLLHTARDVARSMVWLLTGKTGATVGKTLVGTIE